MKPINFLNKAPQASHYKAVHRWFLISSTCTIITLTALASIQFSCWSCYNNVHAQKKQFAQATQALPALLQQQQQLALEEKTLKKNVLKLSHYAQGNKNPLTFLNHIKTTLANNAQIEHIMVKNKNIEMKIVPTSHETLLNAIASLSQHELCTNISVAEFSQKEKKILATLKSSHTTKT